MRLTGCHLALICGLAWLQGCVTYRPMWSLRSDLSQQFVAQYQAADWALAGKTLAAIVEGHEVLLRVEESADGAAVHDTFWRMAEVAERVGMVEEATTVLRALIHEGEIDAPHALAQLAKRHGDRVWNSPRTKLAEDLHECRRICELCWRGEFAAARALVDGPEIKTLKHARFLLGDLLQDAGELEAALVEYTTATWCHVDRGRTQVLHSLGNVRIEALLYDMGEPVLASEAMAIVNHRILWVPLGPFTRAQDQRIRAALQDDVKRAERTVGWMLKGVMQLLPEPADCDLVAACTSIPALGAARREGETTRFVLDATKLSLAIDDKAIVVETASADGIGSFRADLSSRRWYRGAGCFEFVGVGANGPRCVRLFGDGSLFVGTTGFESSGVFVPKEGAAIVGAGHFGRPIEECLRATRTLEDVPVPEAKPQLGAPRRQLVAKMADGTFLFCEGYSSGDRIVPDGPAWVYDPDRDWYTTAFKMGEPGVWRRRGALTKRSSLSRLKDARGQHVAWQSPTAVVKTLEVLWQEQDRVDAERNRLAEAEREERYQANMRQRDEMLRGWEEDRQWRREHESSSQPVAEACLLCSGSGLYASNDIFGQSTIYLQGTPGSPPQPVTVSRPAGPRFNTCPVCRGTGKR